MKSGCHRKEMTRPFVVHTLTDSLGKLRCRLLLGDTCELQPWTSDSCMGDKDTITYRIGGLKEMQMLADELRITLCMFVVVARVVFVPQVVQVVIAKQQNCRVRVLLLEAYDILQIVVLLGVSLKIISIVRIEVITKEDIDHIGAHQLAPSVATMYVAYEVVGLGEE